MSQYSRPACSSKSSVESEVENQDGCMDVEQTVCPVFNVSQQRHVSGLNATARAVHMVDIEDFANMPLDLRILRSEHRLHVLTHQRLVPMVRQDGTTDDRLVKIECQRGFHHTPTYLKVKRRLMF
ncbi:hypothetical protein HDE_06165 [Halotydeus destructor]|nr:hypothetical protein HDE_06165 [Halotydeus destructor]